MGGGGDSVSMTPAVSREPAPEVTSAITMEMDGARSSGLEPIFYNATVGRVAQSHAQDMVDRNYFSIFEDGTDTCAGVGGLCDMGDDLNDISRNWDEIVQMVARGDKSIPVLFSEFRGRTVDNNVGDGDLGEKLDDGLQFQDFVGEGYEFFGLGKAGSGDDTKWAFIFVDPRGWSDR
jgi:hypothetical protein